MTRCSTGWPVRCRRRAHRTSQRCRRHNHQRMDRLRTTHAPRSVKSLAGLRRLRILAEDCRIQIVRAGGDTSDVDTLLADLCAGDGPLRTGDAADAAADAAAKTAA